MHRPPAGFLYNTGMTEADPSPTGPVDAEARPYDIGIIGGGAGGVLTALHALRLAREPVRIVLFEPAPTPAKGVAYATTCAEHLLNVPAQRMSAFNDAPEDFLDYVVATTPAGGPDRDALGHAFVERRRYGDYLRTRLQQAQAASPASLEIRHQQVIGLQSDDGIHQLTLQDGQMVICRGVVLAVGNRPRPLPARGAGTLPATVRLEAWDFDAIAQIPADADICIVGSGLSMVDTVLTLAEHNHRGQVHVLSRHALLPLAHCAHAVAEFDTDALLRMDLRQRMRYLRKAAADASRQQLPWQAVMERLRPHGQALWQSLSLPDQRRFLRHAARLWDVHRHRIAPSVHACISAMRDRGQLQLHRGRVDTAMPAGPRIRLTLRMHDGRLQQLDVDRVVNATGVEMRAQTMRNPLLTDLLGRGYAQPGTHGIGIKTARDGTLVDADGNKQAGLVAIGSLRIGCLWESIAVPELRGQAEAAARQLLLLPSLAAVDAAATR